MKYTQGQLGRVFLIRLEDGDRLPDCVESFAEARGISVAQVILIGGIIGGQVVVGPRKSTEMPPEPMLLPLDGAHEVAGVGVIAPDEQGKPVLHIHAALGRAGQTTTGCLRPGVDTWLVGEAVIIEILNVKAERVADSRSKMKLLDVKPA